MANNNSSFEEFIIQCCKASEPQLRKWIKKVLPRYGFTIQEDNYLSERVSSQKEFATVHNMLAIRANKGDPRICLVAHTDVCRDHKRMDSDVIFYGNPANCPKHAKMVEPIIKHVELEEEDTGTQRLVIQDKNSNTQVGGDDRLGVAINLWIALQTGYNLALYFPTDEEVGLKSARMVEFPELKEYDLCIEVDRGNHSNELVNKIHSTALCDYDTTTRLLSIAYDVGHPRTLVNGNGTDVYALKERKMCKNAVNMTCGYHSSHGSGPNEYIDIEEARHTMYYVSAIIRDYELNA